MAAEIEVIMDRNVNGGEFLQGLDVPEFRHRAFSSSKRLVRVSSPVVEPAPTGLVGGIADHFRCRSI